MENQEIQLSVSSIVHIVAQALLYTIGLIIQMKVMYICWKDKDGKTWQIHLTHSLSCTLYFLFVIPFWHISTSIPHLSVVTGEWLCYLSAFVTLYGIETLSLRSGCIDDDFVLFADSTLQKLQLFKKVAHFLQNYIHLLNIK